MNNVELLRQRCVRAVLSIGQFASMLPGGSETSDRLKGPDGSERLTRIVDHMMHELGHEPNYRGAEGAADGRSPTLRLARKVSRSK